MHLKEYEGGCNFHGYWRQKKKIIGIAIGIQQGVNFLSLNFARGRGARGQPRLLMFQRAQKEKVIESPHIVHYMFIFIFEAYASKI